MSKHGILFWGIAFFSVALVPCMGQERAKARTMPQAQAVIELPFPIGGIEGGPEAAVVKKDLSMHGPGGPFFVYLEDKNLEPQEQVEVAAMRVPGPGEPGFVCVEQANLYPGEFGRKTPTKDTRKKKTDK